MRFPGIARRAHQGEGGGPSATADFGTLSPRFSMESCILVIATYLYGVQLSMENLLGNFEARFSSELAKLARDNFPGTLGPGR